jgi:Ca-activated chloride channel family protein
MNFANKELLWLLLVLPAALVAFYWWSWRQRQKLLSQFVEPRLLGGLLAGISPARRKLRHALIVAAVGLLVIAAARPQWGYSLEEVNVKGLDIVVAVDTSKSMLAEDITPNRLARAKLAALDLLHLARTDRLGLVAFAGGVPAMPARLMTRCSARARHARCEHHSAGGGAAKPSHRRTAFKEGDNHQVLVIQRR